jgi:hypothetical protein
MPEQRISIYLETEEIIEADHSTGILNFSKCGDNVKCSPGCELDNGDCIFYRNYCCPIGDREAGGYTFELIG